MTRIVFMGTPAFAVPTVQALLAAGQLVGVVTQPDRPAGRGQQMRPSPVKELASAASIPVYQPKSLRQPAAADPIRDWRPDLIVVAAYGQILRPHLLELPPHGCLNVHASLLPRWRGASPIQHAILAGDTTTGISLMKMDEGLDTGPVYVQRALPIGPRETAADLHDRLAVLGAELLGETLARVLDGRFPPHPQDDSQATYAPLITKEDGRLDWDQPATALDRRIRAMTPWPGAFTTWQGERLKILAAHPVAAVPGEPGAVCVAGETAVVATGHGGLALAKVQLAGRRPTAAADFLRGHPEFAASRLGDNTP